MNVFWLDDDLEKCAKYHCDRHVTSQVKEYSQIIGEALQQNGYDWDFLRSGYKNHPVVKWAAESFGNMWILYRLEVKLFGEHIERFGSGHRSYEEGVYPIPWEEVGYWGDERTEPPKCVGRSKFGDKYVRDSVVDSYRAYYIGEKKDFCSWTNRDVPWWFEKEVEVES